MEARIEVQDRLSAIGPALAWAEAAALDAGLSPERRDELQVCLEEVLANLILHGVPLHQGKEIGVAASSGPGTMTLRVTDACRAFDPRRPPKPIPAQGVGGRGLRLLVAFAPNLEYRSGAAGNELVMTFGDAEP